MTLGSVGKTLWLGLPGNPQAAFACWHVFGRILTSGLRGAGKTQQALRVRSVAQLRHKPGRCEMRPARLVGQDPEGRLLVTTDTATHSARTRPLAEADGLLVIPAQCALIPPETLLDFIPFEQTRA